MRSLIVAVALVALALPASADQKCRDEVDAAFAKQRKQPAFRSVIVTRTGQGNLERTVDFVPPDKMYAKVVSPTGEAPMETIAISKWAWANSNTGWEEVTPNIAQTIQITVREYNAPPKTGADFNCVGKTSFEGKDLLTFKTDPAKDPDGNELVTTIFVDESTGLPMYNLISEAKEGGQSIVKSTYTYGPDIIIQAPFEPSGSQTTEAPATETPAAQGAKSK